MPAGRAGSPLPALSPLARGEGEHSILRLVLLGLKRTDRQPEVERVDKLIVRPRPASAAGRGRGEGSGRISADGRYLAAGAAAGVVVVGVALAAGAAAAALSMPGEFQRIT